MLYWYKCVHIFQNNEQRTAGPAGTRFADDTEGKIIAVLF